MHDMGTLLALESSWARDVVELLSVPALVFLNGLFVAAEFSLVAVRRTRVEEMVHQGIASAKALEGAIDRLDRSIAATQLGVTLASLGLGWVGEPALARLLEPLFHFTSGPGNAVAAHTVATGSPFCRSPSCTWSSGS